MRSGYPDFAKCERLIKGELKMKFLVTGAAGFIGSHFVKMLLASELELDASKLVVLDKLTYAGSKDNLVNVINDPRLSFIEGDICDVDLVSSLMQGIDVVVNFAAESHVDRSIQSPNEFLHSNILGTQNLLNASLPHSGIKFIQVSTDEVYGSLPNGFADESYPLRPNSAYAASKASADLLVRAQVSTHNMDARITRCTNNYGPNQHSEKFIPTVVRNLRLGNPIPIYGDGRNIRDWIYVGDHCRAIAKVIEKGVGGEIYNIGGGNSLTNLELVRRIACLMDIHDEKIEFIQDRKGHDSRYAVNSDSTKKRLNWEPVSNFDETLRTTISTYL